MGLLGVDVVDLVDVIAPRPYLITGGAALERFDLTDQHVFGVTVLVPGELGKVSFRGRTATFFKTDPENIWGSEPGARPSYALPERAIVDALNHPRYGLALILALDALVLAASRDSAFLDRLHAVVVRYGAGAKGHGSRACARRVGLIVERLFGPRAADPYRDLVGEHRVPTLLRPGGARAGPVDDNWRIVVNAALEPERAT
jgi:predicted transcriptional regulator of viral defense system